MGVMLQQHVKNAWQPLGSKKKTKKKKKTTEQKYSAHAGSVPLQHLMWEPPTVNRALANLKLATNQYYATAV
jgi:hypothetical protein